MKKKKKFDAKKYVDANSNDGNYVPSSGVFYHNISFSNTKDASIENTEEKIEFDESIEQKEKERELMRKKVYEATREIDEKYELWFDHKCQYKGCSNIPTIDKEVLHGDMYICQVHRREIANNLEKEALNKNFMCDNVEDIINKLKNYDDKQFIEESNKLGLHDDYFANYYSESQCKQFIISEQLSIIKKKILLNIFDYEWNIYD